VLAAIVVPTVGKGAVDSVDAVEGALAAGAGDPKVVVVSDVVDVVAIGAVVAAAVVVVIVVVVVVVVVAVAVAVAVVVAVAAGWKTTSTQ